MAAFFSMCLPRLASACQGLPATDKACHDAIFETETFFSRQKKRLFQNKNNFAGKATWRVGGQPDAARRYHVPLDTCIILHLNVVSFSFGIVLSI